MANKSTAKIGCKNKNKYNLGGEAWRMLKLK